MPIAWIINVWFLFIFQVSWPRPSRAVEPSASPVNLKIFVTNDPSFISRWQKHSFIDGNVFDLMTYIFIVSHGSSIVNSDPNSAMTSNQRACFPVRFSCLQRKSRFTFCVFLFTFSPIISGKLINNNQFWIADWRSSPFFKYYFFSGDDLSFDSQCPLIKLAMMGLRASRLIFILYIKNNFTRDKGQNALQ